MQYEFFDNRLQVWSKYDNNIRNQYNLYLPHYALFTNKFDRYKWYNIFIKCL